MEFVFLLYETSEKFEVTEKSFPSKYMVMQSNGNDFYMV